MNQRHTAGLYHWRAYTECGYAVNVREREFQTKVLTLARMLGWRHMHISESTKRVRRGGRYVSIPDKECQGWPDLTLVHPKGRVLFRELKLDRGVVTDEQQSWLNDLAAAGADADVWRPRDWERIVHELGGRLA